MKERKHRKRTIKREKLRRKREKRQEEEEIIKERRRRKALHRHMQHKQKLAKKIMSSHWSTRKMSEERKKDILKEVHGETIEGSRLGSYSVTGSEGAGRRPSTRSSTSVWSLTSGGCSSWYGGSQIHHRANLCVYSEGNEGGKGEDALSDDISVTNSGDTAINME